jgi:peptidoglycan/xylan/chitin deacetylase (PgdA/CDA1 family)
MRKKIIIGVLSLVVLLAITGVALILVNEKTIVMNIPKEETVEVEYGKSYDAPTVTASYEEGFLHRKETSLEVVKEGTVDTKKLGTYEVTYTASYQNKKKTCKRKVVVADKESPVIELVSDPEYFTSPVAQYEEEGYTATDNYDGDLTEKVVREEKDGVVTYTVSDSSGNTTTVTRNIVYKDVVEPEITLEGEEMMSVQVGSSYSEPGYHAQDDCDGDLTSKVSVEGSVDAGKIGVYSLTYSVSDSYGNVGTATRTVYVFQKQAPAETVNPGDKVVYLTFDDGPGQYTSRLLDTLDKYGVKATFFVTNQYPAYQNLIAEEYQRGHTVAIHSYSHDYATVYCSDEAYFADLNRMSDICYAQTGVRPSIIRFPGGSSNSVSSHYSVGIMTRLSKALTSMGYQYCDWNVSSGDAGGTTSTEQVVSNVISGIRSQSVSIILQHDIKGFSVDAVEQIIVWGLANGYTFLPMDSTTPMVHQPISN